MTIKTFSLKDLAAIADNNNFQAEIVEANYRDIAIIGMAGRFPLADNLRVFWENLKKGRDCVGEFPPDRKKDIDGYIEFTGRDPVNVRYSNGAFLEEIDKFDYRQFRLTPKEAGLMNPNQRMFLESAWEAIEDAGYNVRSLAGTNTGVYVGYMGDMDGYRYRQMIADAQASDSAVAIPGNLSSIIPGRISYLLDLKGPAMLVDTACSSSLVAVHLACSAIRNGDCDMALAGGVRINLMPFETAEKLGIESSDGRTRPFDDSSDGTGIGEGVAAVLLKPLDKALKNRDNIYAVIKGSAINQDGSSPGITAPNAAAQSDVIIKAWKDAGIDPETITYIEAHGTGTRLGDPIEIEGIKGAFKRFTDKKQFCAIGSVKSNINNLFNASGIACLIKSALMLKHKKLVPSIHFDKPNSKICFEDSPVYVNSELKDWNSNGEPLRCGVNSFSISGTNCHLVLEEMPAADATAHKTGNGPEAFVMSARTEDSLVRLAARYLELTGEACGEDIKNILYTANTGRDSYDFRAAMIVKDMDDLRKKLGEFTDGPAGPGAAGIFYNSGKCRADESRQALNEIARNKVKDYVLSGRTDENLLAEICRMYAEGADINWAKLYEKQGRKRVSIPGNQPDRSRCWIKIPETGGAGNGRDDKNARERRSPADPAGPRAVKLCGREKGDYTAMETMIAGVWGGELGYEEINIFHSFLQLGGDSILAAKVADSLSRKSNKTIKITDIVRYPTVNAFAGYLEKESAAKAVTTGIGLAEEKEYYPLSSAQKRLYILNKMNENELHYNLPYSIEAYGAIDIGKIQEVFEQLISRHGSFRTSFHEIDGEPVQIIHKKADFRVEYFESAEENLGVLKKYFIRSFDLSKAPLLRAGLVKITKNRFVLLIDMHHIISDGTSMGILLDDFSALYEKKAVPVPAIQYKDYAVWQNKTITGERLKDQAKYWLKVFSGEIPVLNIPADFGNEAVQRLDGNTIEFEITRVITDKLKKLEIKTGATLYMILLAAYNVLLSKYSGSEDIIVGTPSAGRPGRGAGNIIGMFVNTLAMRNYPKNDITFEVFLQDTKENSLNAFDNQDFQFDAIVDRLGIKREPGENPLFNTMFVMQNMEMREMKTAGLKFGKFRSENPEAVFDIVLEAFETETIRINLQYRTGKFKESTMKRFAEHYLNILTEITENPGIRLTDINMMSKEEEGLVLNVFNDTKTGYPLTKTAHELFEEQVKKMPDKTALVFEGNKMSYDELNKKSNQLARLLMSKGVKAEKIVAIMAEQSLEMIIGILAVLKAGGAYLPIDPKYPGDRIKFMLADSDAAILLTQEPLADKYRKCVDLICLDDIDLYKGLATNPDNVNSPGDLAYVIYTSGSTGQPKGVLIEHKGLMNMIYGNTDYFSITSGDNSTKYAGFGFDGSVFEIFPFLTAGATLHIISDRIKLDITGLNTYFEENKITIGFLPTQLCEQFMKIENKSLTRLLTAGDKLKNFIKKDYVLYNNYGPTENTVCATACAVMEHSYNIPVGKPLPNIMVYIVDIKTGKMQPIGIPGEICISGESLARGYLNRQDLTDGKFVKNIVSPKEKMYRTGDLGRWMPDGNIEFLGRLDCQVKIRGFRIELGEIESRLLKHELVKEAVVIDRTDAEGNKYLCGYVVMEVELPAEALRRHLMQVLPDYMVPDFFICVQAIPLTANGKVDRAALPEPDRNLRIESEYEQPDGEIEEILAGAWKQVLGIDRISVNDNFFSLGGNSIKAIQTVSKLSENFQIGVNDLFQHQTIRGLAANLNYKKDNLKEKIEKAKELADMQGVNDHGGREMRRDYDEYMRSIKKSGDVDLKKKRNYENILLTGATGFLGAYLLRDLLQNTGSRIYAVIRGESAVRSGIRLKQKLDFIFKGESIYERFRERIIVLNGDIAKENLGLKAAEYRFLSNDIDGIINSAANVRHYGQYGEFYGINVMGVERLIQLASAGRKKDIHHVSTMSVGSGKIKGRGLAMFSENECDLGQETDNYYIRTKLEAEKLIIRAGQNGINASIYRVGNLVFDSKTGRFQENINENGFYRIVRALIGIGIAPATEIWDMDFSFIDHVSRAFVLLAGTENLNNGTYHLSNPHSPGMRDFAGMVNEAGYEMACAGFPDFLDLLYDRRGDDKLKCHIEDFLLHSHLFEKMEETRFHVVSDKTNILLKALGFDWEVLEPGHIKRMLEHCREVGFMPENESPSKKEGALTNK